MSHLPVAVPKNRGRDARFAITARRPMMCRCWASRANRYRSSLAQMIALAQRALELAVSPRLRRLSRSHHTRRSASRPSPAGSGCG
ncbi:MAG TPA: hypothetical protein VLZ05_26730 [Mycobacterium sp.]|nr:hypothetical protein [Mycobacterium sp.]HUH72137.1 hypothetical protein [Mycobacterium sp.]